MNVLSSESWHRRCQDPKFSEPETRARGSRAPPDVRVLGLCPAPAPRLYGGGVEHYSTTALYTLYTLCMTHHPSGWFTAPTSLSALVSIALPCLLMCALLRNYVVLSCELRRELDHQSWISVCSFFHHLACMELGCCHPGTMRRCHTSMWCTSRDTAARVEDRAR